VKALAIPKRPLPLLVGFCIAGVIFFHNFSIAGFGATLVGFLLILFLAVVAISKSSFRIPHCKTLDRLFIAHLLFSLSLFFSFYINGSTSSEDVRYLLANAVNICWWHILFALAIYQRNIFCHSFKIGYLLLAYVIIIFWIFFALKVNDIFFLRHGHIGGSFFKITMIKNPNRFARIVMIITVTLYFFYQLSRVSNRRGSTHLLFLIIIMSFITVTTLSRANLVALATFGVMAFAMRGSKDLSFTRSLAGILVIILVSVLLIFAIPEIPKGFMQIKDKLGRFVASINVEDARNVSGGPRVRTWVASVNIVRDHLAYGVGFSQASDFLNDYGSVTVGAANKGRVITVHGGFLKAAVYGGLIGLGALLLFYLLMLRYAVKIFFAARIGWNKMAAYSACILLVVMIPVNIAGDCFGLSLTWMSIAFLFVNAEMDAYPLAGYPEIWQLREEGRNPVVNQG